MFDPDIFDADEAQSVVDYYEYTLMDDSKGAYHYWLKAKNISTVNNSYVCYILSLSIVIAFICTTSFYL